MWGINKKNNSGSLTVEACIIFPVFLCFFFLLLFMAQAACLQMTLDHAVSETAKEIAAHAYPLSFLNELEDEKNVAGEAETGGAETPEGKIFGNVLVENVSEEDLDKLFQNLLKSFADCGRKGLRNYLVTYENPAYFILRNKEKYEFTAELLEKHLAGINVKKENWVIKLVEFPQSQVEFEKKIKDMSSYEPIGLFPVRDFSRDDVVIQLECRFTLPLPIFNDRPLTLKPTAIEKAWLHGGNGVYTNTKEKSLFEDKEETVYVTPTGERYHHKSCFTLYRSRLTPLSLSEAKKSYTPCGVCFKNPQKNP